MTTRERQNENETGNETVRHVTFTVKHYFDTPYQSISHSLSNRKPIAPERNPQMMRMKQPAKEVPKSLNFNSMLPQLPMRFPQEEEQRDLMTTKGRHSQSLSNLSEKYHSKEEPMRESDLGQCV